MDFSLKQSPLPVHAIYLASTIQQPFLFIEADFPLKQNPLPALLAVRALFRLSSLGERRRGGAGGAGGCLGGSWVSAPPIGQSLACGLSQTRSAHRAANREE